MIFLKRYSLVESCLLFSENIPLKKLMQGTKTFTMKFKQKRLPGIVISGSL